MRQAVVELDQRRDLSRMVARRLPEEVLVLPQSGPEDARLPYAPMVWGVFPMFENGWRPSAGVWFVTDYNSGLWTMKLERPEEERPIS